MARYPRRHPPRPRSPDPSLRQSLIGSPVDQIPRKQLAESDIDVNKSYEGEVNEQTYGELDEEVDEEVESVQSSAARHPTWEPWGRPEPLVDPRRFPMNWTMRDDDIDPNDLDALIVRCHERICDNIMPHIWEQRLEEYTFQKKYRIELAQSEPEGLSWESVQRIKMLRDMEENFTSGEYEDTSEQLPNIRAILRAYRTKKVVWHPNLVTYWSYGRQLCEPRPFDWDEFEVLNQSHGRSKGFWMEGMTGLTPGGLFPAITTHSCFSHTINVTLALRLPGYPTWAEFPFMFDTGADMMAIYHQDLSTLMAGCPGYPPPPIMNVQTMRGFTGLTLINTIQIEVTILDDRGQRMTRWTRVPCGIKPGQFLGWGIGSPRLDGPFLRNALYLGFQPSQSRTLHIANSHSALSASLPVQDLKRYPPPSMLPMRHAPPPGNPAIDPMPGVPTALTAPPYPMPPKAGYTAES